MSRKPVPAWVLAKIERDRVARERLRAAFGTVPPPPTREEVHQRLDALLRAARERNERNPPPF